MELKTKSSKRKIDSKNDSPNKRSKNEAAEDDCETEKQNENVNLKLDENLYPNFEDDAVDSNPMADSYEEKGYGQGDDVFNEESEQEMQTEEPMKFTKDFRMKSFRQKLKGDSFIPELRHFLHIATKTKSNIIAKYIEKKGKPLELVEALDRIDKSQLFHISYICHALQLVLMEILKNHKELNNAAVNACHYFIKSHSKLIEKLLKSTNTEHRKIVLKLLTAIVCLAPQLGRQLLTCFDSTNSIYKMLLWHSKYEIKNQNYNENCNDGDEKFVTVRKCYIHFILSYLIEGNLMLIKNLLDKYELMNSLLSGLVYDDHVTVCVVLNTLRKYVLECTQVSKTKKIHIFDSDNVKHLLKLYDWKGPKYFSQMQNKSTTLTKKENYKNYENEQLMKFINPEENRIINETVHGFLKILLTSRKYGIAFDAITNFRIKHNYVQLKCIQLLIQPWKNDYKSDLIIQILKTCPELARQAIKKYSIDLNYYKVGNYWTKVSNFLYNLINELNPRILQTGLDKITITDFSYWIKDICLPADGINSMKQKIILQSDNFEIRYGAAKLLYCMFKQHCNYMNIMIEREKIKGNNDLRKFKFEIINHLFVNFPTIESIVLSLYDTMKKDENETDKILMHLEIVLDLILLICNTYYSFINKTPMIINFLTLIRPLYETTSSSSPASENNNRNKNLIHIEMKAIKTILLLQPKSLLPHEELFENVVTSLINSFVLGSLDDEYQHEAGRLLKGIFMNTGLFVNDNYSERSGTFEIDLWLEALRYIDEKTLDNVKKMLIMNFQQRPHEISNTLGTRNLNNDNDDNDNRIENIQQLFENIEKGVTIQEYIETPILGKLYPLLMQNNEIQNSNITDYIDIISLFLYYFITQSKIIKNICTEYDIISKTIYKFMLHWSDANKSGKLKFDKIPYLNLIYSSILDGKENFYEIFQGIENELHYFKIQIDNKEIYLNKILKNERLIVIFILQIIFIVSRQIQNQNFTDENLKKSCIHYCCNLIKILWYHKKLNDNKESLVENDNEKSLSYFEYIVKYIYCSHLYLLQNFKIFPVNKSQENYLNFIIELTNCINSLEFQQFHEYTKNFRKKLCNQIIASILDKKLLETTNNDDFVAVALIKKDMDFFKLESIVEILNTLKLSSENCLEILEKIALLNSQEFFMNNKENGYTKSIYYDILIQILNRISELKESMKIPTKIIVKILNIYVELSENLNIGLNLEKFEDALYNFLNIYHFYISSISENVFRVIFKNSKLTKTTIHLAYILLERRTDFNEIFINELLKENLTKKELIYPLLNVCCKKELKINESILQEIYHEYKSGIIRTIDKPQKAGVIYKENLLISFYLIENCMPSSECCDFTCKNFKFDTCEIYQMKLIEKIFKKAIEMKINTINDKNNDDNDDDYKNEYYEIIHKIFVNYLYTALNLFSLIFKREQLDFHKFQFLIFSTYNWIQNYSNYSSGNFEKILNSVIWQQFCKNCLKFCMQTKNDLDINSDSNFNDRNLSDLLKTLAYFCNIFYANDDSQSNLNKINTNDNCSQIFDMIVSHSKFFDIVLSQNPTEIKTQIMHLLLILVHKNNRILNKKHIPIYLGAYQAKLTNCDRYILALLQFYENSGIDFYEYRPFIWGESAISHYSLKDQNDEKITIEQQEPSIIQVMSLIDPQISEYTLKNFPIWRKLNTLQQLPECIFSDPNSVQFGKNRLENMIENENEIDSNLLKLCVKRDDIYFECYDPAFIIPLMSMSFAPEVYSHPVRPVQNGLLAICFAALSSHDKNMRLVAGCVQLRYRQHFENHKFFDKPIWQQAYSNIQNGLNNLRVSWLKHKKRNSNSSTIPRVPYISSMFLAKSINTLTDPTNILYKTLTMYLRLKDTFNFLCIPEFNVLFHSPEIEHQQFRQFILEIIRDGIKCSSDLILLITTNTFKALLGFFGSTMSNLGTNLLILSIISVCVKIPHTIQIMINQIGIISWLDSIICNIEYYYFDTIEGLIIIINNLWYSLKCNENQFHNYKHLQSSIFYLLIKLSPFISGRLNKNSYIKFLNILTKTAKCNSNYKALSEENLNRIINCSRRYFNDYIWYLNNIKLNGGNCIESEDAFYQKLHVDEKLDKSCILGLISLREFLIEWAKK